MLKNWTSHNEYKKSLISNLTKFYPTHKFEIFSILPYITKLYIALILLSDAPTLSPNAPATKY